MKEGYHTALMRGQYPVTFLFLEMDPEAVDVNVHPAKAEVRFLEPGLIHEILRRALVEVPGVAGRPMREISRHLMATMIEPRMEADHVGNAIVYMAGLPLDTNVLFMTVMATKMPFVGRG